MTAADSMTYVSDFYTAAMSQLAETRAIQATHTYGYERGKVSEKIDVDADEIGDAVHPKEMANRIALLINKVPEEYRDSATVEVLCHDGWHEWLLEYQRPETDAELQYRINLVRSAAQRQEVEARAQYEALKKTFG